VKERNRELLDAERMVAAGQVASMVGHDLRGPLQTISNALHLLKSRPEEREEFLAMIEEAVYYASNMLEELRNATKDTPLYVEEFDLKDLIVKAIDKASPPASVEVYIDAGEEMSSVFLDPMKMRRVLDNLIRNAIEALPEGGEIHASAWRQDEDLIIQVKDSGVGIPEEFLSNLFKPFQSTKTGGLGLGLSYCKRAIEAHGGSICVKSMPGVGTTFTIRIPETRLKDKASIEETITEVVEQSQ